MFKHAKFTAPIATSAMLAAGAGMVVALGSGVATADSKPDWVKPVSADYDLTASYNQGGARWTSKHSGQDFAAPTGTNVRSVHSGTVVEAGWGGAYGNNIVIKHGDGIYTQYAHLSKIDVSVGETVNAKTEIGKIGTTGNSTGPHLHFEVRTSPYYGSAVDPVAFLTKHDVKI
ncbi:M23 family metallopeptidase [Streptomyces sp. WMMC500]|uniref:M23 family metallopeptidase n=1 Tax=Streptomyces sp. WMMC500 TaxID=3015154 RepID=UPI00248C31A7|nr:M23 family metallopeptidase [Streptomyces sp. WMMC500]WBB62702.1 M23 family metallopeptidase [Streptomyces sp. WMMC500]